MHEEAIINSVLSNLKDIEKIKEIEIEVGELFSITPEHLLEHLKERVGFEINVKGKKSLVKCSCGFEGEAKIRERLHDLVIFVCSKCGGVPEVKKGKDIKIIKIVYK